MVFKFSPRRADALKVKDSYILKKLEIDENRV
jgi:hypothetical protein